eukprot:s991_g10.t1
MELLSRCGNDVSSVALFLFNHKYILASEWKRARWWVNRTHDSPDANTSGAQNFCWPFQRLQSLFENGSGAFIWNTKELKATHSSFVGVTGFDSLWENLLLTPIPCLERVKPREVGTEACTDRAS